MSPSDLTIDDASWIAKPTVKYQTEACSTPAIAGSAWRCRIRRTRDVVDWREPDVSFSMVFVKHQAEQHLLELPHIFDPDSVARLEHTFCST